MVEIVKSPNYEIKSSWNYFLCHNSFFKFFAKISICVIIKIFQHMIIFWCGRKLIFHTHVFQTCETSKSMGSKMCFARAGLTVSVCFLWTTVEKVTVYQLRSALCCVFVHICVCLCAFVLLLIPEWFPEWLTKRRQCETPITLSLSLSLYVCVCVCLLRNTDGL